jgi:hypothetical protein
MTLFAFLGIYLKLKDILNTYVQASMLKRKTYYVTQPQGHVNKEYFLHVLQLNKAIYKVSIVGKSQMLCHNIPTMLSSLST